MSILSNRSEPSHQKMAADSIKETAFITNKRLVRLFADGINLVWNNPKATPQQVCDELGTDAKEVFELHAALGQFLDSNSPNDLSELKSRIGSYTLNSDGTVTVN
jgi:hypothetical protein